MDLLKLDVNSRFATFRVYVYIYLTYERFREKWWIHIWLLYIFVYFKNILESRLKDKLSLFVDQNYRLPKNVSNFNKNVI